jgi:hypothetical protein
MSLYTYSNQTESLNYVNLLSLVVEIMDNDDESNVLLVLLWFICLEFIYIFFFSRFDLFFLRCDIIGETSC